MTVCRMLNQLKGSVQIPYKYHFCEIEKNAVFMLNRFFVVNFVTIGDTWMGIKEEVVRLLQSNVLQNRFCWICLNMQIICKFITCMVFACNRFWKFKSSRMQVPNMCTYIKQICQYKCTYAVSALMKS